MKIRFRKLQAMRQLQQRKSKSCLRRCGFLKITTKVFTYLMKEFLSFQINCWKWELKTVRVWVTPTSRFLTFRTRVWTLRIRFCQSRIHHLIATLQKVNSLVRTDSHKSSSQETLKYSSRKSSPLTSWNQESLQTRSKKNNLIWWARNCLPK